MTCEVPFHLEVLPSGPPLPGSECPVSALGAGWWLPCLLRQPSPDLGIWAEAAVHLSPPAPSSPHPRPSFLPLLLYKKRDSSPCLASFPFLTQQGCPQRPLSVSPRLCVCVGPQCAFKCVHLCTCVTVPMGLPGLVFTPQ